MKMRDRSVNNVRNNIVIQHNTKSVEGEGAEEKHENEESKASISSKVFILMKDDVFQSVTWTYSD